MKIAIVEDEQVLAEDLADQLRLLGEAEIELFASGEAFLFAEHVFDLVFLDIQMKKINGIDTAKQLRAKDQNVAIVFLTNDASFVFDGYEVEAIRYWMKPVQMEKLKVLLMSMQQPKPYLLWNQEGEMLKVYEDDIYYFESNGHYVICHFQQGSISRKSSFRELCDAVSQDFLYTHRSYCVNLNHIHAVLKEECCMDNQVRVPISRSMKGKVQEAFMKKCKEHLLCKY